MLELSKIVEQPQPTNKPWLVPNSLLIPPNPASRPFPRLDHAAVLLANGKNWRAPWDDGGEFSPKGLVILDPKNMVSTVIIPKVWGFSQLARRTSFTDFTSLTCWENMSLPTSTNSFDEKITCQEAPQSLWRWWSPRWCAGCGYRWPASPRAEDDHRAPTGTAPAFFRKWGNTAEIPWISGIARVWILWSIHHPSWYGSLWLTIQHTSPWLTMNR